MHADRRARGFSLVELVIVVVIVGLLAAIAIPRFSRGASGATDSAIAGDLAVLRNAIEMYAAEHTGTYPKAATFSDQLTLYSDAAGNTNATRTAVFEFGPYLHAVPKLKAGDAAGDDGILATSATSAPASETPAGNVGWVYNEDTGQIWANEEDYFDR